MKKQAGKILIISNRLPIKIERQDEKLVISASEGGLATGLGSIYNKDNNLWIGWPGIVPKDQAEKDFITETLSSLNLIPIFLTEEEIAGYYEGFSNEVLWPISHYSPTYANYNTDNWHCYQTVNQKFADLVQLHCSNEDTVWIHDYQLMLLPHMIRQKKENIAIGYFQHIPFPPDEVFRSIPWRDELLRGILGADLIAFHTFNDTQHFLDACTHILGLSIFNNNLQVSGRTVYVEVYPIGIDFEKFNALSKKKAIKARSREIREHFSNRKIIVSVDRLDYSKGILPRIAAFEDLLLRHPEWKGQVVLYMLVVPSRDTVDQYKRLKDEIDRKVGNINAAYGNNDWTPIVYFYTSYPVEELVALYRAADICLVTSVRDGMNLVSKEYIACKEQTDGVLILSELAGASKELIDAIQINPHSIDQIRDALSQALTMPKEEQHERMAASIALVKKFNIHHWVDLFFTKLKEIKMQQGKDFARRIRPETQDAILKLYQLSKKRLFFLDYDGTLIGFNNDVNKAAPTNELYDTLDKIQASPNNQIVIISGRPHQILEKWFANKNYILVGEHGVWKKYPDGAWKSKSDLSNTWKASIKKVMHKYANKTAGAFIEEKEYSLAWHYRKTQEGLGQFRAQELIDSMRYLIPHHGLQLLRGDKVIEVKNRDVNKGKAALSIVRRLQPDFIFAIGDDATDEDMFIELPKNNTISIKVGNKKSVAKFYVENQHEVATLLQSIFVEKDKTNVTVTKKEHAYGI
ncbi:bifunctional alpha,alpha-trehalose-phosphate synthase (UDP-forming)/trehalose-phosphatase [Sphingobacterium psychroaquaticum]|uniref:bifunctional alpha,alpha-trehalose-phosphate synthase (UDP-forming)/trehalose-phosphatase n=1 Tax=Sphingobacterium psychroaquaticum TaxID=561061 RepID=UPI00106A1A47|nr:bifunctional alpha,alpha-trehalose-phosphate synthase (UDP-forming)/trehalose-phosphatase [Sphingobacterium psychroaquaticum]QBQ41732.1 bifunctional alpha,alpha-trehalose-phosphate synthase (UDP-forming)/trehalose-phosphatase [Sphingobacterium psychroaquaticum]